MPVVAFMPYFSDRTINERFGSFELWNWKTLRSQKLSDPAVITWLDDYFGIYCSFQRSRRVPEDRITIVCRQPDGPILEAVDQVAEPLKRFVDAVMFCHLVTIPLDQDAGFFSCPSDNFILFFQGFNPASKGVSLVFGSWFRMENLYSSVDLAAVVTPDYVLDPQTCLLERKLLGHLSSLCDQNTPEVTRLFRAIDWLRFVFTNAPEHKPEARIVSMATVFEILLDIPEHEKGRNFSAVVNALLPPNALPRSKRSLGKKDVNDNEVGWWCRDFYDLRSRIVHGDRLAASDFSRNGVDQLKVALFVFEECVWGLLVRNGACSESERRSGLTFRRWVEALQLPLSAF